MHAIVAMSRIIETRCLGICPKKAGTAVIQPSGNNHFPARKRRRHLDHKLAAFGRRGKRHGAAAIENRRSVAKTARPDSNEGAEDDGPRAEVTRLLLIVYKHTLLALLPLRGFLSTDCE